jgi:predicted transcriptional regulator
LTRRYRSRNDIIVEMLMAALECTYKTKIMFIAYLSFDQIDKEYLPLLLKSDLLVYDKKNRMYCTTEKGKEFVEKYKSLKL